MKKLLSTLRRKNLPPDPVGFMILMAPGITIQESHERIPFKAVSFKPPHDYSKERVIEILDCAAEAQCLLDFCLLQEKHLTGENSVGMVRPVSLHELCECLIYD